MSTEVLTPATPASADQPRRVSTSVSVGDRVFRGAMRAAGLAVLALTGMILAFLLIQGVSAFRQAGISFFSSQSFTPTASKFGIAALLGSGIIVGGYGVVLGVSG